MANTFAHTSRVHTISFYVLGTEEAQDDSNVTVTNKEMFKSYLPISEGCYDAHMGTTDHSWLCETCGNVKTVCPGHVGSIDLNYPVKNPLFREQLLKWLKVVCFDCGRLLIEKPMKIPKAKILTEHVKIARNVGRCLYKDCGAVHPMISKDKYANSTFVAEYTDENDITRSEQIFNHEIQEIVNKISDETVKKMGKPLRSHPSKFVLSTIRVAPNTIRPDIRRMGGNRSNNSDITALTKNIIEINEVLPDEIPPRERIHKDLQEMYYNLDSAYYELVKGSSGTGNQLRILTNTNKAPNSIANRIPKKEGRIRRNLMGKRVRHMMRSVITGDNLLKVDEVGIPKSISMTMSIPEIVRSYNRARLTTYYMNRNKTYPGCRGIIKKSNGVHYNIKYLDEDYELQDGDTVLRHLIDGDVIGFNRQPSLLYRNISCHKVRILDNTSTFRLNVSACVLYNADFDGDAMVAMIARNIQSRNEISKLSSVGRWMISYQNSAAEMGCFQDALIGTAEFTKNGVNLNKWHAMQMFSQVDVEHLDLNFQDKEYTSRDIISMVLPKINYTGKKPQVYMSQYSPFIKYDPSDIKIEIDRGRLVSGILDKATVGQGKAGSIFHIINNEYGPDVALRTIYSFQQITTRFFLYSGFTTGIEDINLSERAITRIKQKTAALILESRKITEKLNNRKLIAPIGTVLNNYYEMLQMNSLEPGDDFVEPIFGDINFKTNKLMRMVATGSKGKMTDIIAINGAIGSQTIGGNRPLRNFSWGRTSPYFARYDTEPKSLGYISNSYKEGIPSGVFPFATGEARHGSISNALSTSITGHQNRLSVKNLESILVDNMRKSSKPQAMIQPLYAESGLDPRKTEKVRFPTVKISHDAMKKNYHTQSANLPERFRNPQVQKILDEEYEQLVADREFYRDIFLAIEDSNPSQVLLDDSAQMPVNVYRIIEDIVYNYKSELQELPTSKKVFDPVLAIQKVKHLCEVLPYAYYNDIQEKKRMALPIHITTATTLLKILVRSYLCTSNLIKKGIVDSLLDIVISRVKITFKKSLIDYGTSIGIIAAQCVSEPMTQYVLDSKHRVGGGGGTKTNTITRIKEIMGARQTSKMKNPAMLIMVPKEFETNKSKVQEIANHIEMMKFDRFINTTHIFFEKYGMPLHSKFKKEAKMITEFEKYNVGISIPVDLSNWCIRFELNKEEMIINSMKLETIINVLRYKLPDIFFVYTPENSSNIVIRCYIRQIMIKVTQNITKEIFIMDLMNRIKNMVIRGVKGIKATDVIAIAKSKVEDDGSILSHNIFGIDTTGTNLESILENPYVDPYRTQCDSILEFESVYGIEAARNKVVHELRATMSTVSKVHTTIYADEMSFSGQITSIQRTGLQQREMSNVTLRLSFQSPIQVIENAATDGLVDRISGVSGPMIMGSNPHVGTMYNKILVNEKFLQENAANIEESIEDEL
jgi:DNA-directed RNA polymerase II subunit RPB1